MLMKVFNKGQIVIPAELRRLLDIHIGDQLEVAVDREQRTIELQKPAQLKSQTLAGSLASYASKKPFPTPSEMQDALAEGLRHG